MYRILIAVLLFVCTQVIGQERRLALVIGNSDYSNAGELKNPVNDANLMASTLSGLGFEVIKKTNATKSDMEKTIYDFSKKLGQYNIALFYYAGHGIQVDGSNYLIPVDAELNDKLATQFEAIDVSKIVSQFERYPDNVNIVILDACRNNPFKTWSRGGAEGFSAIPAPSGTIIAYATGEGATASDGDGANGLYTTKLVEQMKIPQRIEDVFIQTRVEVRNASDNEQSPQEWSQLTGKFYFNAKGVEQGATYNTVAKNTVQDTKPATLSRGSMKSEYEIGLMVADLLSSGHSIRDIIKSGVRSRYFYGVNYQGGMIAKIDEDKGTALLVTSYDLARGAKVEWDEAKELCESLSIEGYSGWKLPKKSLLQVLYDNLKKANFGDFSLDSYWSSTESGYHNAWGQSFSSGGKYDFDKTSLHHVRAVRTINID